jgi:hypothetical protein
MTAEKEDISPTELETPFHPIPPMLPALPRSAGQPASSAACAYTSGTSHADLPTDIEETYNIIAPVAPLLFGIGASFAAEEEQVKNPAQVLGQYSGFVRVKNT